MKLYIALIIFYLGILIGMATGHVVVLDSNGHVIAEIK